MLILQRADGSQETIDLALTVEDGERLNAFVTDYDKLALTEALKHSPYPVEILADPQKGAVVQAPLPSDDVLAVLLHRLRPFVLHKEPYSYNNVASLIGRAVTFEPVRRLLKELRKRYDGREWQEKMRITSGATVLNSDEILMTWLNAWEYHRDQDKQKDMSTLFDSTMPGLLPWVFVKLLFEKSQAIKGVAVLARLLVGIDTEVPFSLDGDAFTLKNTVGI